MTLADMQNVVLSRLRGQGLNFGGAPSSPSMGTTPLYQVTLYLNYGYNEFLTRTMDYQMPGCALKIPFSTLANVSSYPLYPPPNTPSVTYPFVTTSYTPNSPNPAVMRVFEMTYTQSPGSTPPGQELYVPLIGTTRFRQWAGGYTRRLANYSSVPEVASQQFGKNIIDILPGTAVAGDLIQLTIYPDIIATGTRLPASGGGVLVNATDVPLVPPSMRMALVEYAVMQLADSLQRPGTRDRAEQRFEQYLQNAMELGFRYGEGDSEQVVFDPWTADGGRNVTNFF